MAVAALTTWTSCNDEVEYTPAEVPGNAQVYFPSTNSSTIELSVDGSSFNVTVMRVNTDEAQTVSITAACESSNYTIPSSVSFAQGEETGLLTIGYDADAMEYDDYTEITLTIADESATTPYGLSVYTFTAGIPAPWTSLGYCTYTDDFMTTFYSIDNLSYSVEIQENDLYPGYFRLVNPYGAAYGYNEDGDWDDSQDWYLEIHAEDPTAVYMYVQETGMDWGYGMISVGSLAGYYMEQGGHSLDEVKAAGYTGTYEDGIITFPAGDMLISMANYNSGGLYYANNNGAFRVVMPGTVLADYSLSVSYNGKYTDTDGNDAGVLAEVTEIGSDLEEVRVAVVEGTDVSQVAEGIANGTVSYVSTTSTGLLMVPFDETPVDGRYTVVAVGYADGEAEATASATFTYMSTAETWTEIATGDYTYTLFFGSEDEPALDSGLTLYQSDSNSNRYKIEHWGYDVDFIFTYDAETGEVVVSDQETGYVHPSYGMVYVDELADYAGTTEMGTSYYEDGTFYFCVVYYVSAGNFDYGYETFTLNDSGSTTAFTKALALPQASSKKIRATLQHRAFKSHRDLNCFK